MGHRVAARFLIIFAILGVSLLSLSVAEETSKDVSTAKSLTQRLLKAQDDYRIKTNPSTIIDRVSAIFKPKPDEILNSMISISGERKRIMLSLMENNTKEALRLAIPAETRNLLPPEVKENIEAEVYIEGVLEILHSDDFERPENSRVFNFIRRGRERFPLHPAEPLSLLVSGTEVGVSGILLDKKVALSGPENFLILRKAIRNGSHNSGPQETVVILIRVPYGGEWPPSATVHDVIFNYVNSFSSENSFGRAWLTGNVYGWYNKEINDQCNPYEILEKAVEAADPDVYFPNYERIVIVHYTWSCWIGAGTIGKIPVSTADGPIVASVAWISNWYAAASVPPVLYVIGHELGHNSDAWHAAALDCGGNSVGDVGPQQCTSIEYGDPWEIMGTNDSHMNAYHKELTHWLPSSNLLTATNEGIYTIKPLESSITGIQALKVPISGKPYSYYLEYRQPIGFDARKTGNLYNGVLIHIAPYFSGASDTKIIDANPGTQTFHDAALEAGKTFVDTINGITIAVLSLSSDGATVQITRSDVLSPTVSITSPSSGAVISGTITISASATDDIGVTKVEFYHDGALIGDDTTPPYDIQWNTTGVSDGRHNLTAKAYDAVGKSGSSPVTGVTVDNIPPKVSVTSPSNGAMISGVIDITASASDNSGMAKVEFYQDGVLIGDDTNPYPYSTRWNTTSVSNGNYSLTAKAYDLAGNVGASKKVVVTVDNTRPNVSITSPSSGAVISGTVVISANATDNIGVTKVEFYRNGTLIGSDRSAPYKISWNTTTLASGTYILMAKAHDAAGKVGASKNVRVTVDNIPPKVSITSPSNGAVISGVINISANATDNVRVARVEFYRNGTLIGSDSTTPYTISWDTKTVKDAIYTLTAKAYDAAGNLRVSRGINVTVKNNATDTIAPMASIISPSNGAIISRVIKITANATDNTGVTKVELYQNGIFIGENATSPYTVQWNTTIVTDGNYSLTAKAYDAAGNTKSSSPVTVMVDNTPPTVSITSPSEGAAISNVITITADATDNVGISRVDFYGNETLIGLDKNAPYEVAWHTQEVANGTYFLRAKAYDVAGKAGTSKRVRVIVGNTLTIQPTTPIETTTTSQSTTTSTLANQTNQTTTTTTVSCASRGSCSRGTQCSVGTICSGFPAYGCYPPRCPMPICLSSATRISTPEGEVNVKDLRAGMMVWTLDEEGRKVAVPLIKTALTQALPTHRMAHIVLADGRELFASPGHPTADGRIIGQLSKGDVIDGSRVVISELVSYEDGKTYDILPDGRTGFYWANGILIGSTLHSCTVHEFLSAFVT